VVVVGAVLVVVVAPSVVAAELVGTDSFLE
jgi:hypothetical protein